MAVASDLGAFEGHGQGFYVPVFPSTPGLLPHLRSRSGDEWNLMTPLGCEGVQCGPDLKSMANPPKLR